jgi:hypothetical protein
MNMNKVSNTAEVNDMEHEDIIYEDPDDYTPDAKDGEIIGDDDHFFENYC